MQGVVAEVQGKGARTDDGGHRSRAYWWFRRRVLRRKTCWWLKQCYSPRSHNKDENSKKITSFLSISIITETVDEAINNSLLLLVIITTIISSFLLVYFNKGTPQKLRKFPNHFQIGPTLQKCPANVLNK